MMWFRRCVELSRSNRITIPNNRQEICKFQIFQAILEYHSSHYEWEILRAVIAKITARSNHFYRLDTELRQDKFGTGIGPRIRFGGRSSNPGLKSGSGSLTRAASELGLPENNRIHFLLHIKKTRTSTYITLLVQNCGYTYMKYGAGRQTELARKSF